MLLGEAASAAWAELSPCREQEPNPPSTSLQAYFASLLLFCQVGANQVGQNNVCTDILPVVGLTRHSGHMLNFPLLNGSTSIYFSLSQANGQTM